MVTRTVQIKGLSGNLRLEGPSQRRGRGGGRARGGGVPEGAGWHTPSWGGRPQGPATDEWGPAAVAHGGQLCGLPGWEDLAHQAQGHGDGWDPVAPSCTEDDSFCRAHLA